MDVFDAIEKSLLEDREEARLRGEPCVTDAAITTCRGMQWLYDSSRIGCSGAITIDWRNGNVQKIPRD